MKPKHEHMFVSIKNPRAPMNDLENVLSSFNGGWESLPFIYKGL